MGRCRYPEELKLALIQKVLSQPRRSIRSIAKEAGVSKTALHEWVTHHRNRHNVSPGVSSLNRTLAQRLKAVTDCSQLCELDIGKYCRTHGIYREHLEQWKESLMNDHESLRMLKIQAENQSLRKQNLNLENALKKIEKCASEANALLELKKKVSLLLGENADN